MNEYTKHDIIICFDIGLGILSFIISLIIVSQYTKYSYKEYAMTLLVVLAVIVLTIPATICESKEYIYICVISHIGSFIGIILRVLMYTNVLEIFVFSTNIHPMWGILIGHVFGKLFMIIISIILMSIWKIICNCKKKRNIVLPNTINDN